MEKPKKRKSILFYKFFLSYLMIFLIPFTTISIIFYHMYTNNLKEEIIGSSRTNLEQVRDLTDVRMNELRNIATRISYNHRLTPYQLNQPYSDRIGIEELINYQVNSSIIDDLILYYNESDTMYSTKGKSTVDNMIENVYRFVDSEKEFFKNGLKTVAEPMFKTVDLNSNTDNEQSILTYIYPIPPQLASFYGSVVFIIKKSSIKQLISNTLGEFEGDTYVFNKDHELLISNQFGDLLSNKLIDTLDLDESGVFFNTINGEDYSQVIAHSNNNDLIFVTVIPTEQFYSKMSGMKTTILVMVFIIAFIGLGTTIYLSIKQYKPIGQLIDSILKRQTYVQTKKNKTNELEQIQETIDFMFANTDRLEQKLHLQNPFVRERFLLRLLKENVSLDENISEILTELKITFKGNHFFVVIIKFNERISEESIEKHEQILNMLEEVVFKNCKGYGTELFHENGVALIVSMEEAIDNDRKHFTKKLTSHLEDYFTVMPTIGVGEICSSIKLINRSFIEAAAAVEHYLVNKHKSLIYFEEIAESENNPLWYPIESQVRLTQSLKQGDQMVAIEALQSIIQNLKTKEISIHLVKLMCIDVINTVLKISSELGLLVNLKNVNQLTDFNTLEDLESNIKLLISDICRKVEDKQEKSKVQLQNQILIYIKNEFHRNHLSLGKIAEKFGHSPSYLSKFIKEQTGLTFTQFIWELRLKAFKDKLLTTDDSIKNIVAQVGYVDAANFTREFRKVEGLTPGKYREHYKTLNNQGENVL